MRRSVRRVVALLMRSKLDAAPKFTRLPMNVRTRTGFETPSRELAGKIYQSLAERVLRVTLLTTVVYGVPGCLGFALTGLRSGLPFSMWAQRTIVAGLISLLGVVGLILTNFGRVRAAVWCTTIGLTVFVLVTPISLGLGIRAAGMPLLVVSVMLAALLISPAAGLSVGGFVLAATVGLYGAETLGWLTGPTDTTAPTIHVVGIILVALFATVAFLTSSASRAFRVAIDELDASRDALASTYRLHVDAQRLARLGHWEWSDDTQRLYWSEGISHILGLPLGEAGTWDSLLSRVHPDDESTARGAVNELLQHSKSFTIECRFAGPEGAMRWFAFKGEMGDALPAEKKGPFTRGTLQDIHDAHLVRTEREQLLQRLNEAERIESLGRLAGGVAHDFNNMLAVIVATTDLVLLDADGEIRGDLEQIRNAAQRSADLTKQLLGFARRQHATPRSIELNKSIDSTLRMLRRLVTENIELVWSPGEDVRSVSIDPVQLDQILANLCMNARDSIENGGSIQLSSHLVFLSEADLLRYPGLKSGHYASIVVKDSGCGMEPDVQAHIFEPFFTTKKLGRGTGLGLATIYGMVRQNGGTIDVSSTPGEGSSFTVLLPACVDSVAPSVEDAQPPVTGSSEVILVVDDEPELANVIVRQLRLAGYICLEAHSPEAALKLVDSHHGRIDLLLTDVVMPQMNGPDLSAILSEKRPSIKTLFMSGHTADIMAHNGLSELGKEILSKPFEPGDLLQRVRDALST